MRNCEVEGCNMPVFSTDKLTGIGYCKSHSHFRTDTDKRSPYEKHLDKQKITGKVRGLKVIQAVDDLQYLKIDLDRVVSRYVRLKEIDSEHKCECFTCGRKTHYLKQHCGHFINRIHLATRWLIQNLRVQCVKCNIELRGNIKIYAERLEQENKGSVEFLQELSRTVEHPTRDDLKQLLFDYQQKLKLVEYKLK